MPVVRKSALVPYSVEKMFDLVEQVEHYPSFLPWCGGSEVIWRNDEGMAATIRISFKGISQSFSTENLHRRPDFIKLKLREGPFTHLNGDWHFKRLTEDACRIDFQLDYDVKHGLLARLLNPVFGHIATTMVDAFVKQAEKRYGPA
ncbi:MAG: type II toxin-antitoxin system RatA family toxin [Lautropia sp.]|nr:type II toxin-antitoxin system RatA family toxin [Lautropia sp.]